MVKIVDCFLFYNEIDLLKIRLEELYDVVDYFILVEGTLTFTGNVKNMYFKDNINLFNKYLNKIIYIFIHLYIYTFIHEKSSIIMTYIFFNFKIFT